MTDDQPTRAAHDTGLPAALAANLLTGWADPPAPAVAPDEVGPYTAKRRAALTGAFPGQALVIPAGAPKRRANDTDYPFRAASDYVWLTGDTEPDGVLVLTAAGDAVLYVPGRAGRDDVRFFADRDRGELWVGRRPGPRETGQRLGVECRSLDELRLPPGARVLRGVDPRVDEQVPGPPDQELAQVLSELRLVKDEWEVGQLRAAAAATARGFADAMREREGALAYGERWLEGTFWRRARAEGNDVGYSSIVACGPHATVLHWTRDDGPVRDGDLLLLDMGVEVRSLYTADVTRTLPVSGRYSPDQRRLHDLVAAAQRAGMAAAVPGADFLAPNRAAMAVLAAGLHDWGVLRARPEDVLAEDGPHAGLHRRYTLHNVSHMLGLDVHDCASARPERYRDGTLAPGMVLTVEPGLYFQPDDLTVPPELRGLGVRIEDDVLVGPGGPVNLSDQMPGDAAGLESWMAALG